MISKSVFVVRKIKKVSTFDELLDFGALDLSVGDSFLEYFFGGLCGSVTFCFDLLFEAKSVANMVMESISEVEFGGKIDL